MNKCVTAILSNGETIWEYIMPYHGNIPEQICTTKKKMTNIAKERGLTIVDWIYSEV